MLTVVIRSILIFLVLLIVIRMMGKRQIGEMEPFELAITLVIAELACIPIADKSIPLTFGIISILTMYVIHQVIILLSKRNRKFQDVISGTPIIVIDKNGVRLDALQSMNMQMNDLLQAMRAAGYFSVDQIAYAIFETNGQLSVIPYPQQQEQQQNVSLPVPLIVDGQWVKEDVGYYHVDKTDMENIFKKFDLTVDKLLVVTVDEYGKMLIQPENQKYITLNAKEELRLG